MNKMVNGKIVRMSAEEVAEREAEIAAVRDKPARVDPMQRLSEALRAKPERLAALLALLDR